MTTLLIFKVTLIELIVALKKLKNKESSDSECIKGKYLTFSRCYILIGSPFCWSAFNNNFLIIFPHEKQDRCVKKLKYS